MLVRRFAIPLPVVLAATVAVAAPAPASAEARSCGAVAPAAAPEFRADAVRASRGTTCKTAKLLAKRFAIGARSGQQGQVGLIIPAGKYDYLCHWGGALTTTVEWPIRCRPQRHSDAAHRPGRVTFRAVGKMN